MTKIEWTHDTLKRLLAYNPDTGALTWTPRVASDFAKHGKEADRRRNIWNTKYAGKLVLNAKHSNGYRYGQIFNQPHFAHRVIWELITGTAPDQIDHINGDRSDNRWLPDDWGGGYGNVWLGATVENQAEAERRIPMLAAVPASVRFLSCEPMLGPVRPLSCEGSDKLDWVICGGESGPGAREIDSAWARDLRDECAKGGLYFFMKQMSGVKKPLPPIPDGLLIRECPPQVFRNMAA